MRQRLTRLTLLAVLAAALHVSARAQDPGESAPPDVAVVTRPSSLRAGASGRSAQVRPLATDEEVQILISRRRAPFLYVITDDDEQGWVRALDVRRRAPLVAGAPGVFASAAAAACACPRTFGRCTARGCACPGTTQAIFNETKRRVSAGAFADAQPLTFDDFKGLQKQANTILKARGKKPRAELSREDRDELRGLTVAGGTVEEGSLVRVVGFIAKGAPPHPNSGGESVNCKIAGGAGVKDFHISLVPRSGLGEFKSVVVEMIPQARPPGWTIPKLVRARAEKRMVMAVGALFLDNIHVVNSNPSAPIGGQPKRVSVWEVHPVKQFFVCAKAGNACRPDIRADWTPLARF
jgi:hypothetical protein